MWCRSFKNPRILSPNGLIRKAKATGGTVRFQSNSINESTFRLEKGKGSSYGGRHIITLIPGSGIGNEVSNSVKEIFKFSGVPVSWEEFDLSNYSEDDPGILKQAIDSIERNKVALKGILKTPKGAYDHKSLNLYIRKQLDIFASVCFIKDLEEGSWEKKFSGVDITIFRENTEGEYTGLEHSPAPGVVESLKVVTDVHTRSLAKLALNYCILNNKKKITIVHKANIMKESDGLFLDICREVAEEYGKLYGIECRPMIVDNASMQLVSNPKQFEVILCGNLYGSILANIGAGLIGGAGIIAGSNFGFQHSLFEPGCRNTATDIQGQNIANPIAFILTATNMLEHVGGMDEQVTRIRKALSETIKDRSVLTPDLNGTGTTTGFTKALIDNMV